MHPEQVAREFFARLSRGEVTGAVALIGDEGEFWQAGFGGPGRILTLAELKEMFLTVIGAIPGGIAFTVTELLAIGSRVVARVDCDGTLANGNDYHNRYCFFFDVTGGRITGGCEYMDTQHATSAFSGK